MRFAQFFGLVPKVSDKSLPQGKSVIAENLDIYGNHLKPIKLPLSTGERLLTPCGDVFTGNPISVYRVGTVYVAWSKRVFTAVDWTRKLGDTTFLFVEDGILYRQSAERILEKQCPIRVGVKRPECETITTRAVEKAGCEPTRIPFLCVPDNNACNAVENPPVPVAYMFTYMNACGEESANSRPSEVLDIEWGDAVEVSVSTKDVPENAISRRWYRAVTDNEGLARWLFIGETPIDQTVFYDTNCPCDFANELETINHDAPPECLDGVAVTHNNLTIVWSNRRFWVSEYNFPHAYDQNNEYRLRFHITGMYEVTPKIESGSHYSIICMTDGLNYLIDAVEPNKVSIAEIEQRYKCINPDNVCHIESELVYSSKQGLVSISQNGEELLTGEIMTENEWSEYEPYDCKLSYHDDRLFGFTSKGGFIIQLGTDRRRDSDFVTHNIVVQRGYTDATSKFLVFKDGHVYEWGAGDNAIYDWRSQTYMMAGMWRPVACKVVSPDFDNITPRGYREAKTKYQEWKRKNPNVCDTVFFNTNRDMQQHYSHLVGVRPSVTVIIYADGREYYRKQVSSNKPFLLPRKYKAIDFSVRVIGSIRIDEIHLEGSREALLRGE